MEIAGCCDCILCLRPSSLRVAFGSLCRYLNTTVWSVLCRHFLQIKFLCDNDMEAICRASKLSCASPSEEMLLRLEKQKDLTVNALLRHVRCAFDDPQFNHIVSLFSPLHTKNCPVYSLTASYFPPMPLTVMQSTQIPAQSAQNVPHSWSVCSPQEMAYSKPYTSLQPPQLPSMNNLSDPFKPYLHIIQNPSSQTLLAGDDLVLKCMAESDATIQYFWEKNGQFLEEYNGKILMIPDVRPSDGGQYACVARTGTLKVKSIIAQVTVDSVNETIQSDNESPSNCVKHLASDKFALLIANERYSHDPELTSASKDVLAIAQTLRELGFKTITLLNLALREMIKAIHLFCAYLKNGAYCVTYLAGHGFENDGQCYIVPVDAPARYTAEHCFSIKHMIDQVRSSCDLNIAVFLLDVCRKRLNRGNGSIRPSALCKKSGNYVISYATMEHGMAYEVRGQSLGVYASSLVKHLKTDKRITRVIELVHSDIHNNELTKGIQRPEFVSNIFEDRKLTDPVNSAMSKTQHEEYIQWQYIHLGQKPNLYIFQCGTEVELRKTCRFSNEILLEAKIIRNGHLLQACIMLKGHVIVPKESVLIDNIQRLNNNDVSIELQLLSKDGKVVGQYHDSIPIPFTEWWKQS